MAAVAAAATRRKQLGLLVQEPVARDVVVDPDDAGRTRCAHESIELCGGGAALLEKLAQRMTHIDAPAEQIPSEPAPSVVELRLIGDARRARSRPEIVRLHELRERIDFAYLAHRSADRRAL